MSARLTRREWLRGAGIGLVVLGAASCKRTAAGPASCTDTTGLTSEDVQARNALAYVDSSTEPGKSYSGCQQFIAAPDESQCGSCKLVKGPIHPRGYCKAFAAKA